MNKLMLPLEEYTIKNESATIPNTEIENPRPKKIKHKKFGKELAFIRHQAHQLTKQNMTLLTMCPKCDKPGYAKYRVRSGNDKLVLFYRHSNEPPIGTKSYKFTGRANGHDWNIYRECWIGNVLSESEFMGIIGKGASASASPERSIVLRQCYCHQVDKILSTSVKNTSRFSKEN